MINVLQIIVHMPLFSVNFPSNSLALYSMIILITKFDILPSASMGESVFTFDDDGAYNEAFDTLDIFWNAYSPDFLRVNFETLQ